MAFVVQNIVYEIHLLCVVINHSISLQYYLYEDATVYPFYCQFPFGQFLVGTAINNAAINTHSQKVYMFCCTYTHTSVAYIPSSVIVESQGMHLFSFDSYARKISSSHFYHQCVSEESYLVCSPLCLLHMSQCFALSRH